MSDEAPLLPFSGRSGAAALDPYWDFSPVVGQPMARALRLWKTRVFVTGRRARARARLVGPAGEVEVLPHRHVGGLENDREAWVRGPLVLEGPSVLLGLDVSDLQPGAYAVQVVLEGAAGVTPSPHFAVARRRFYTGAVRPLRSSTGLIEMPDGALRAAFRLPLEEHRWDAVAGRYRATSVEAVFVTAFDEACLPRATRWALVEGGGPPFPSEDALRSLSSWSVPPGPGRDDGGTGLALPGLVGIHPAPCAGSGSGL